MRMRGTVPRVFVWTTWALMTAALLACVYVYTYNMPLAEDWHLVPPMTGHEPHLWTWLWAQNNEHRLPLPRLVLLAILKPTHDLRWGMVANVAMMSGAAFAILRLLARVRGGSFRYTDAFVPIALLHIGNWENYMWAWQLCFVLSSAVTLVLLLALQANDLWRSRRHAALAAAMVAALPLCGANGLAFVAPIAAWLTLGAVVRLRVEPDARDSARIILAGVALAAAAAAYYFVGYTHATWNPPSPGVIATTKTSLKFLTMSFGPVILRTPLAGAAILLLATIPAAALALRVAVGGSMDAQAQARRLLAYLAGVAALAIAFGWGRAGLVPTVGLPDRYVLLAVPVLVWAYIVVEMYGRRSTRAVVQAALFVTACVLLPANTRDGFEWRDWYRAGMQAVMHDIDAGMPRDELVRRHGSYLMAWSPEHLAAGMEMLKGAGIGPFGGARIIIPAHADNTHLHRGGGDRRLPVSE